jgi:hypothetical protein
MASGKIDFHDLQVLQNHPIEMDSKHKIMAYLAIWDLYKSQWNAVPDPHQKRVYDAEDI